VPRRSATGGRTGPAKTWPQPVVARILELTGADQIIPVHGTLQNAQTAD
jgi:anti-anti-sigma regulatory factor